MAKYVGRSKQRFYAKKTAAKIMVSCFLVIVACGTLLCYGRQQKGWKTSIYSMEDDNVLSHPSVHDSRSKKEVRADFEQFLQEVFRENVTSDGITLNYTLKNPTDYGIKNVKPTLGHYTKEAMQNARMLTENELAVLERYDYDKLNEEQQLAYDVLHTVWKQDLSGDNVDEYQEPLSPTTGTQTQLPVILTEYHFWDKESVDTYLQLLQKIPDYFDEIITFEQQRSKEGLFMSKRTAQDIITQCNGICCTAGEEFYDHDFSGETERSDAYGGAESRLCKTQSFRGAAERDPCLSKADQSFGRIGRYRQKSGRSLQFAEGKSILSASGSFNGGN